MEFQTTTTFSALSSLYNIEEAEEWARGIISTRNVKAKKVTTKERNFGCSMRISQKLFRRWTELFQIISNSGVL